MRPYACATILMRTYSNKFWTGTRYAPTWQFSSSHGPDITDKSLSNHNLSKQKQLTNFLGKTQKCKLLCSSCVPHIYPTLHNGGVVHVLHHCPTSNTLTFFPSFQLFPYALSLLLIKWNSSSSGSFELWIVLDDGYLDRLWWEPSRHPNHSYLCHTVVTKPPQ